MKNFGKLKATYETVIVEDDVKDDNGNIVRPAITAKVIILRDNDGNEWHDLFQKYPHAFYIATDDNGIIISMNNDPEKMQIADYTLWGIDQDFGETFLFGGSVFGKKWDGNKIVDNIVIPESISRRQFFQKAALKSFITEDEAISAMGGIIPLPISNAIKQLPKEHHFAALSLAAGAQTFERHNMLSTVISKSMNLSEDELDQFWLEANEL